MPSNLQNELLWWHIHLDW